jgi:GT2 family glycosyltransferase
MKVSVVIPTVGRVETLPTVLTALSFQTAASEIGEVILLDEAKTPVMENYVVNQALDVLSLQGAEVKILRDRNLKGIGAARFRLVEEAKYPWVLMVDDDVVLNPSCLGHLIRGAESGDYFWSVPTCRLIPAGFTSDGYIDNEIVDPKDHRVTEFTSKYPWFIPYFRYPEGYCTELLYSGTQAILLQREKFMEVNSDLKELGRLPREDSVMTKRMGVGIFMGDAETLHYEHKSQLGRANWSSSVHYRLHEAAAHDPEAFVKLMSLKEKK